MRNTRQEEIGCSFDIGNWFMAKAKSVDQGKQQQKIDGQGNWLV